MFNKVKEMFYFDDHLIWSNIGKGLSIETYQENKGFFANTYDDLVFETQAFMYSKIQPVPVPLNSVEDIDVKFAFEKGLQKAFVKWKSPALMHQLGCSSWKQWAFDVNFNNESVDNLNTTQFDKTVEFDQVITVQVQPKSSGGLGPKSEIFVLKSWPRLEQEPRVKVMTSDQIVSRNLMNEVQDETFLDLTEMFDFVMVLNGTFALRNESHVYHGLDLAYESFDAPIESMIYEPFGQALYLNIPSKKLLVRKPFSCMNCTENLPLKGARHIQIESSLAKLCWIEFERTVKCSNLPFIKKSFNVFELRRFNEETISNIAIDNDKHKLYILKQGVDQTQLLEHDFELNETRLVKSLHKFKTSYFQCLFAKCFWKHQKSLIQMDVFGGSLSRLALPVNVQDVEIFAKTESLTINPIPRNPNQMFLNGSQLSWPSSDKSNMTYNLKFEFGQSVKVFQNLKQTHFELEKLWN